MVYFWDIIYGGSDGIVCLKNVHFIHLEGVDNRHYPCFQTVSLSQELGPPSILALISS